MIWLLKFGLALTVHAHADSVCAKSTITLRAGPKDNAAITWRAAKYMPFVREEQKNNWAKLRDLEGVVHFARARDVTNSLRCVVVKTNVAALHKDPSNGAPASEMKTVDRYTAFLRLADKGDWIQIKDEANRTSWINKSNVWKPVTVNAISF